MKRISMVFLAVVFLLAGCSGPVTAGNERSSQAVTVFAAASLTDAFTEIGQAFEAVHPGITVRYNFAGSQALRLQLEQGASADVFVSANDKEMDALISGRLLEPDAVQTLLTNRLVVALPVSNPANIQTLEDLSRSDVKLVLASEAVPVGKYARQMLENLNALYGVGFRDAVLENVVSNEENVRQVTTKVHLGEADAGIVYISDTVMVTNIVTLPVPDEYNVLAEYRIAPLASAANPDGAADFVAYALSGESQAILQKWGFTVVLP